MDALDRLTPAVRIGDRLTVRHRLPDGSATDSLGWLEQVDDTVLRLRDHRGVDVAVARIAVLAARRLPPARGGRDPMRASAEDLEQLAVAGWAAVREPLGDWTLRAGGRFTARANSCLAVGDPGVPVAQAAERIASFAATEGAYPWAQVIVGSDEEDQLRRLGWREVHVLTDVLVARLAELLADAEPDEEVLVTEDLERDWEDAYRLSRAHQADPALIRRILDNGAPRAFALATQPTEVIAIGRGHLAADWLGVAAVWTAPGQRRRGWAGRILTGLGQWGARRGARSVYLQVGADHEAALRAYERLGFKLHHRYRYLAAPPMP